MQVLLTIDESLRPGIAAARALYNAALPATVQDGEVQDGEVQTGTDPETGEPIISPRMVPNMVPNPALITSDEAYVSFVMERAIHSYQQLVPAASAPAPAPSPGTVNGVPQVVTKRQGRQALILTGKLALVQPAIDAIPDATQRALMQAEWDDSNTFERQRPSLIQMATAIGLTSDDLDNLFKFAATL